MKGGGWLRTTEYLPEIDPPGRRRLILLFTAVSWAAGLPMFVLAVAEPGPSGLVLYCTGGLIAPLAWLHARRIGRLPGWLPVAVMFWVMSLSIVDPFYVVAAPVIVVGLYGGVAAVLGPRFALVGGVLVVSGHGAMMVGADVGQPVDRFLAVAMAVAGAGFLAAHSASKARDLRRELASALSSAEWEATHDSLTGLGNRRLLLRRLEGVSSDRRVRRDEVWLAVFDLDGFKAVNDAHGHGAGDLVLREMAGRLRSHARETDLVVRIGGDEFAILFVGDGEPGVTAVLDRLQRELSRPIELDARNEGRLTVSVGAASLAEGPTFEQVVSLADQRMYDAKRAAARTRGPGV